MKRILCPKLPTENASVAVPEGEASHALQVLRLRNGDTVEAIDGKGGAVDTPIGHMPRPGDLDSTGLDISPEALAELTAVPNGAWRREMASIRDYLQEFGSHLPAAMLAQVDEVERRLAAS